MAERDLYQILGIDRSASNKEINQAYRNLAKQYHPDRNPGDKRAEEKFKEISYAKDILSNKEKRKLYDEFGEIALTEGFNHDAYRNYQQMWSKEGRKRDVSTLEDLFGSRKDSRRNATWHGGFQDFFSSNVYESFINQDAKKHSKQKRKKEIRSDISIEFMEALKGVEKEFTIRSNQDQSNTEP